MSASDDALETQQQLVEDSLPLVFEAYDDACNRQMHNPVVILLDCEDEIGGEIARGWLGEEAVDDAIAEQHVEPPNPGDSADGADDRDGEPTTVFALAFPFKKCRHEVPAVFPYLGPAFEQSPPQDGFYVVSVTAGGASILTAPHSARPEG